MRSEFKRTEESPIETEENPIDISLEEYDVENILEDEMGITHLEMPPTKAIWSTPDPESTAGTTRTSTIYSTSRSTTRTFIKTSTTLPATPTTSAEAPTATASDTTSDAKGVQSRSLPWRVLEAGAIRVM